MSDPKTMKVKPWGEDQGDHVIINEADFDPAIHTPLVETSVVDGDDPRPKPKPKRKAK